MWFLLLFKAYYLAIGISGYMYVLLCFVCMQFVHYYKYI